MSKLKLTIITPRNIALEKVIKGVTLPSTDGEITILPGHINLFALLEEGIVHYWSEGEGEDDYLAIGGGYVETDGETVRLLVTRAYGQAAIDEKQTQMAFEKAKEHMKTAKTAEEKTAMATLLRRSVVDAKLLKKKRRRG
jgi:F-type H+-transporting ATPase subunit epsilon